MYQSNKIIFKRKKDDIWLVGTKYPSPPKIKDLPKFLSWDTIYKKNIKLLSSSIFREHLHTVGCLSCISCNQPCHK